MERGGVVVVLSNILDDVGAEVEDAQLCYPPMTSAHEGLAIIQEELFELQTEVYKKPSHRSKLEMYHEAKQVAAMAVRFMVDVCR